MNQLKQHATLIVENDQRALKSRSATDFTYQLTQPINFTKRSQNKQYFIRIENIRIPVSFYNINSFNNVLIWTESAAFDINDASAFFRTVTIPQGNYTIDELCAELQTLMSSQVEGNYLITYDDITQKVTISSPVDNGGFTGASTGTIADGSTLNKIIGFDIGQVIPDNDNDGTVGNNIAYTNTMRHLKLQISNLVSNNVYSNDSDLKTQVQPVGVMIPITEIRNEFQYYSNHQGPLIKLSNQTSINDINVKLLDPDNNIVELNGCPLGFEIVFYEYNK